MLAEKYARVKKQKPQFNVVTLLESSFHRSYNLQKFYERFVIHLVNTILKFPRYNLKDEHSNLIDGDFLGYESIKVNLDRYCAVITKTRVRTGVTEFLHSFKGYNKSFDL